VRFFSLSFLFCFNFCFLFLHLCSSEILRMYTFLRATRTVVCSSLLQFTIYPLFTHIITNVIIHLPRPLHSPPSSYPHPPPSPLFLSLSGSRGGARPSVMKSLEDTLSPQNHTHKGDFSLSPARYGSLLSFSILQYVPFIFVFGIANPTSTSDLCCSALYCTVPYLGVRLHCIRSHLIIPC
jgi:hypothetical protein